MYTFQDLLNVGESGKAQFCRDAVDLFRASADYKRAKDGLAYYNKHNVTIENYQKFLYTLSGQKIPDVFSANYKLKTLFFRRLVTQQVQYVLGNGLKLSDSKNKEKLGRDFDFKLQSAAKKAVASGKAFGFWNLDHLEVFGYADTASEPGFCPLYDENTAELMAGIRFWFKQVGDNTVFRATLYEQDGYTDYAQQGDKEVMLVTPKRAYKLNTISTVAGGVEAVIGENYSKLPIVTLYANDTHESELVGIREDIDCYDFIKSGLANNIDDNADFYWVIQNTEGMDDFDLAQFIQRMKTVRAAVTEGNGVEAHTIDVPVEARSRMLEILNRDIYDDFQALDVKNLSAAAKTTQEIKAAYQSQDNKCADFEYYLLDFVQQILEIAGIDDNPTFMWNRVINETEQTNMVLASANYLPDEVIVKHLPFLTPEEQDEVINTKKSENYQMFNADEEAEDNEDEE